MPAACPTCGTAYRGDDVNLTTGLARCRACDRVDLVGAPPAKARAPAIEIGRPETITESTDGRGYHLRMRWYHPMVWFMLFFCIAWDSFLVFWYGAAVAMATQGGGAPLVLMFVFPIAHVAVGVGLTWHTFATLFNSTTFSVGEGRLRVTHGPLPWFGGLDVPQGKVSQLYVVESMVRRNKQRSYKVCALVEGTAKEMITGIPDLSVARYLEQRLEARLGITDAPVDGEA